MTVETGPIDPGRRRLLRGLVLGGVAVGGGVVGAGAAAAATNGGGWRRETVTFDVACLGHLWRWSDASNPANDADFRTPFLVEGWIYPAGTIPGDGFVPTPERAIGHWFCHGWTAIDVNRSEPHAASTHQYIVGEMLHDRLFPPDTLSSTGLEGNNSDQVGIRAITGGTGKYLGATGQVRQINNGFNTTVFADGTDDNAPNFIFELDLLQPDV